MVPTNNGEFTVLWGPQVSVLFRMFGRLSIGYFRLLVVRHSLLGRVRNINTTHWDQYTQEWPIRGVLQELTCRVVPVWMLRKLHRSNYSHRGQSGRGFNCRLYGVWYCLLAFIIVLRNFYQM